ncbi:MAG TPA: class I SAM-dependent methyltransferase [Blastocatellia bacterium]|nr:class I SAM-dependent methyltransferase [Blastocatellia bacterium]
MTTAPIELLLERALAFRADRFDDRHETAFRLFNGFTEGRADLVVDLYGKTLLIHNYADRPEQGLPAVLAAREWLPARLPWIQAVIVKTRNSSLPEEKRGQLVSGDRADRKVREDGVWYAIDLMLNRDASLYLDTRGVRQWARSHLQDKSVLNTFAYTGSLGVAAQAGGAARVVQLDLNRHFLNVAKTSYLLNGFPIEKRDFLTGDFWPQIGRLKTAQARFDCVFIDPPLYSATRKGVVNLTERYAPLINKVRPLINHDGYLVAINNALFVSGAAFIRELESLCADGYLAVEELIAVPSEFIGDPQAPDAAPVTDPAPFNHATKIAVLRVRRKA